jgi:branched-chain amino acid transport system permease protein
MTSVPRLTRARRRYELIAALLVPLAAASLAFVLDDFTLSTVSLWVIYGLLALSLDLVWGHAGIFSFGQTAFFGVAGYTYGAIAINVIRVTGESATALLGAVLMAALLAALLGYFMFYGRVSDVYLAIITLAVTLVLLSFFGSTAGSQYGIGSAQLGGYNGMVGIPPLTLGLPWLFAVALGVRQTYVFVVLMAGTIYLLLLVLRRAPTGRILAAVRENELRTELLGYDTCWYKLLAFTIGGAIAGLAGAAYAAWGLFINPAVFDLPQAAVVVIWVLVGGRGTLAGAFLGAALVEGLSTWLGGITSQTPLVLGLLLILMVLLFPNGLVPLVGSVWRRLVERRAARAALDLTVPAPETPPVARTGGEACEPVLETHDIGISFGGLTAVDRVSAQFTQGLYSLIGPNGAGKSTFFNLLVGRFRPTAGTVVYQGRDITGLETHHRAQHGIGIKLQVPSAFLHLSVEENAWLAAYARCRDTGRATERARQALHEVGLLHRAHDLASHLSHGEQQWLEIGMVVASDPQVILLDEPTAGMTREETVRTAHLVTALARRALVLVVEHNMDFVRQLGAPVTVMHQGRIFKQGALEEIQRDDDVLHIYLGRQVDAVR